MSSIKTLMLLLLLALSLNVAACETTAKSQSESGAQGYGVQGAISRGGNSSGLPWDAYGGP
jgi:hypothetical protein